MRKADIRQDWLEAYERLSAEAEGCKQVMIVPFGFLKMYDQLVGDEKEQAQEVMREWLFSDKSKFRWLAKFIIRQRLVSGFSSTIEKTVACLRRLPTSPQLRDEIEDLENLINELNR